MGRPTNCSQQLSNSDFRRLKASTTLKPRNLTKIQQFNAELLKQSLFILLAFLSNYFQNKSHILFLKDLFMHSIFLRDLLKHF